MLPYINSTMAYSKIEVISEKEESGGDAGTYLHEQFYHVSTTTGKILFRQWELSLQSLGP